MGTSAQKKLQRNWTCLAVAILLSLVFSDFLEANAGWVRWLLLAGIVVASASGGRSRSKLRGIGRERMVQIFEATPWLKIWFSLCAIGSVGFAMYAVFNSVDVFRLFGLRFLVLSFVVLLGPFVFVSERERFRKLGEGGDAI
jgi:hypothetical protein